MARTAAGAAVAALLLVIAGRAEGKAAVAAGLGLVALVTLPLLLRLREDRLDGPGLYGLMVLVTYVLTGLAFLGEPASPGPYLTREDVARALVVVAGAMALFVIGSRITAGRPERAPALNPAGPARSWKTLAIAYVACLGLMVVGIAVGRYGYVSSTGAEGALASAFTVPALGSTLVILATAIGAFVWKDRRLLRLVAAMIVVQVPVGFIAGAKGESIVPVMWVALAAVAAGRVLPWRALAAGVALLFLVLVPANQQYRKALRIEGKSTVAAVRSIAEPSLYRPDRGVASAFKYIQGRFRYIDHVALIVRDTPSVYAYGDGADYVLLPLIVLVPRPLWDGKPVLNVPAQFSHTYWEIPPSIKTAQPVTQIGDLYRNFDVAGTLIGMLLWGFVIGGFQRCRRSLGSARMTLVYVWGLTAVITYVESDLPNLIATSAKLLPIVALTATLLVPGPWRVRRRV